MRKLLASAAAATIETRQMTTAARNHGLRLTNRISLFQTRCRRARSSGSLGFSGPSTFMLIARTDNVSPLTDCRDWRGPGRVARQGRDTSAQCDQTAC